MERLKDDLPWRVLGSAASLDDFRNEVRLGCVVCTDIVLVGETYAPWPAGTPAPSGAMLGLDDAIQSDRARHVHDRCWRWFVRELERHGSRAS